MILKDSALLIEVIVSALILIAAIVLFVVSIKRTAKGKKKSIAGIICGSLLSLVACIGIVYGALGMLIKAMVPAFEGVASELADLSDDFTTVQGSKPIPGGLKINDNEITLPCTIAELKSKGFETDNKYLGKEIKFWYAGDSKDVNEMPYFYVCIDNDDYARFDYVKDDDLIVAVKMQEDNKTAFELNGIYFRMSKAKLIDKFGIAAFEKDNPAQGDALYYLGDDGLMYRFIFSSTYQALWNVTVGTSEYMEIESKNIYQG